MEELVSELEDKPVKRNYTTLWVMIILFGLPYIAAMYFYMNRDSIVLPTSNYGTLVSPVKQVPEMSFDTIDNKNFSFTTTKGKWVLLTIGKSSCARSCQENIYKLRQIRKAVGQERGRVERVFLLTDKNNLDAFKGKLEGYAGMIVALTDQEKHDSFLAQFKVSGITDNGVIDGVYIVDPLGNFMMAYPGGADAEEMLKDIRRLLKVSKIG